MAVFGEMYDLNEFTLKDMLTCGAALRQMGVGGTSAEEVATRIVRYLYESLGDRQTGDPACSLIRCFKTYPYGELEAGLQASARKKLGAAEPALGMRCLTLLASAGLEPEWNSRHTASDKVIPLVNEDWVRQLPMMSQLLQQFGLEISTVLEPDSSLLFDLEQQCNVFYAPEAGGSPFVSDRAEFLIPSGVKSVLGMGGLLPSGDLFVLLLFSKIFISLDIANLFQTLGLSAKIALLPFDRDPNLDKSQRTTARQAVKVYSTEHLFRSQVAALERLLEGHEKNVLRLQAGVSPCTDITIHQQTAEALRESEAKYRLLFDNNPHPMWVFDVETLAFLAINQAAICHYGYSREEFLAMKIVDIRPPEDISQLLETVSNHGDFSYSRTGEWRHRKRDGTIIHVEITSVTVLFANKQARIVLVTDISDRKRVEDELRQVNEHLEFLVSQRTAELVTFINALPDYIFVVNREEMRMPFCNHLFAQATDLTNWRDVEGKTIFECFSPENAAYFAEQNRQVFESGETLRVQESLTLLTSILHLDTFKIPLKRADGEVYALIGSSRDITELTEARQVLSDRTLQLEEMNRQLDAANRELDSFCYSVSHDLRAPLRHINGFVTALQQELEQSGVSSQRGLDQSKTSHSKIAHYLQIIEDSSDKMGLLINGLLTLSRLSRRQMESHPVHLRGLVDRAIALLSADLDGDYCAVKFEVGKLPIVNGDAALLQQVFSNLISNAVKFSRVSRTVAEQMGRFPKVEIGALSDNTLFVRDNGVGFQMQYADQLFGAFQRLHAQHEFEGTGIGLAIVQRIVHRHGGTIWAESELGQGATFYFKFDPT